MDDESARNVEDPVILDEESPSSGLVRQRQSSRKRRDGEPNEQGAGDTHGEEGDDTINTDRYAL